MRKTKKAMQDESLKRVMQLAELGKFALEEVKKSVRNGAFELEAE